MPPPVTTFIISLSCLYNFDMTTNDILGSDLTLITAASDEVFEPYNTGLHQQPSVCTTVRPICPAPCTQTRQWGADDSGMDWQSLHTGTLNRPA